ncbi:MAG: AzlD domain-containing protein [Clostridia bacterium]|nr:AzlD domain-containing protein [Clostridia bacterium]
MSIDTEKIILYIAVMALVTYAVRCLPLTLFRKEITNVYIKSFLHYIPYAVLGTMTVPDIFYSTGNAISAIIGLVVAVVLSYMERSLLTVAASACIVVFLVERLF